MVWQGLQIGNHRHIKIIMLGYLSFFILHGTSSKLKKSTIFPETWSDTDIINSINQIGDTEAIGVRMRDQTTLHRGTVNGVQIEVMKIGSYTTSGYPTGGYPMDLIKNDFIPIIFE